MFVLSNQQSKIKDIKFNYIKGFGLYPVIFVLKSVEIRLGGDYVFFIFKYILVSFNFFLSTSCTNNVNSRQNRKTLSLPIIAKLIE